MFRPCPALLLGAALLAAPAHAHRNEPAVRARVEAFAKAWSTSNPQAVSAFFEVHGDLLDQTGHWARGKMEIELLYQAQFSTIFKGSKMVVALDPMRFLDDHRAVVDATATIDGLAPQRWHLTGVWHHEDDEWRMVSLRCWPVPGK